jgi:hypothetical protein
MNAAGPGRLLGSTFAAIFIIAIVSLLVGFGVPVGIGAAAGFVFGALVGLVSIFWIARGPGRAVTFGSTQWSSSGGGVDPAEVSHLREMTELAGIDLGRTSRVVPVLATEEAGGYAVQVIAAAINEAGLRLDVDVRRSPGSAGPGFMAEVSLHDDVGTTYRASGQSSGGNSNPDRYTVVAVPAPPDAARQLNVHFVRFLDPFPGGERAADGPWEFTIALPASGSS